MNLCRSGKGGLSVALEAKECFEGGVSCTIFLTNVSSLQHLVIGLLANVIQDTVLVLHECLNVIFIAPILTQLSVAATALNRADGKETHLMIIVPILFDLLLGG